MNMQNDYNSTTGIVTDFKRFAVHDGDGIRTTVFLKGCPLRCVWCHNPESISPKPELAFYAEKCTGCGECARICPMDAHIFEAADTPTGNEANSGNKPISDSTPISGSAPVSGNESISGNAPISSSAPASYKHRLDRTKCVACGKCAEVCVSGALKLCGRRMSVDEVMKIVAEDRIFYETSNGGMTLSGGEPTLQPEFALALLRAAKEDRISTALDTCGCAKREVYESLLPYTDIFLYDIKHITDEGHIRCTGRPNRLILDNLRFLSDAGAKIEIRIPFVPGYNDDAETLDGIGRLLSTVNITKAKLLPYHSYARSKYLSLGIPDTLPDVERPNSEKLEAAAKLLRGYGANVDIG